MNVMFDKPFNNELNKYTFRPNTTLEGQVKTKQGLPVYTISMTANNTNVCPVFVHHKTNAASYAGDPFLCFAAFYGTSGSSFYYTFLNGDVNLTPDTGRLIISGASSTNCTRIFANQANDLSL